MKKITSLFVALFAIVCSASAQMPSNGAKGYLYDAASKLFVTADATLGEVGELFTAEASGEKWMFKTDHLPDGSDHGTGAYTNLSVRNLERVTTTEDYGYSKFEVVQNEDNTFIIKNTYDRAPYVIGQCLGVVEGKLVFGAEEDATAWTFMSVEEYNELKGIAEEGDDEEEDYTGPGYTNLTADMFRQWDDAVNPTTSEAVACEYHINEAAITVYGNGDIQHLYFADLSGYDKLIVVATNDNKPRIYFNKVENGKYNANDEAASGRIEVTTAGGWAQRYYSVNNGVWTVDLAAIVKDKGYARLNGIKGPTYDSTVTVSHMVLYKDPTTGIAEQMVNGKWSNDQSIYNLQGQRLNSLQRGFNIVDGKKIYVK